MNGTVTRPAVRLYTTPILPRFADRHPFGLAIKRSAAIIVWLLLLITRGLVDTGLYVRIPWFWIGGSGVMVWMLVLITRGADDTGLYVWTLCFSIEGLGVTVWLLI